MPDYAERTRKFRCTKCQRVYVTFRQARGGPMFLESPPYGLVIQVIDLTKFLYLLKCSKCGHEDMCVLPMRPDLQVSRQNEHEKDPSEPG